MASRSRSASNNSNSHSGPPWISNAALKKLCTLLRSEGDKVLNGSSAFTLTTEVLCQLNVDCRRHSVVEGDANPGVETTAGNGRTIFPLTNRMRAQQEAAKAKADWSAYMQFIKDFMLSTPSLKVIHYSGTLSSSISLHRFGNLSCLHLRKIPIHMVEGLHKLRATLTSLTVYRCVESVKDLIETCGGDMSAPLTWPRLQFLSLMFNSISSLDDSLRLLPYVEIVDLSHNSLETCDIYLEYLADVQSLTLAYNSLTRIPFVSLSMRASLTCLVMRGNNLDSVKGIQELTGLQDLDLGENCLSDHSFLDLLFALTRLRQLQLDGNPLFYHRLHRPLTVSCLARQAVTIEFVLDKKKLTLAEISYFSSVKRHNVQRRAGNGSHKRESTSAAGNGDTDTDFGLSPSSGIGSENDSSADVIASPRSSRKTKRKRLKARQMEIRDLDLSGDVTSSRDPTPGSSPGPSSFDDQMRARREEARRTQREIEELRRHYGPNWLQAIEDRGIFKSGKKKKAAVAVASSYSSDNESRTGGQRSALSKRDSEPDLQQKTETHMSGDSNAGSETEVNKDKGPTDDDLYLTDTKVNEANNPIMAAIARLAEGHSTDDTDGEQKPKSVPEFPVFGTPSAGWDETDKNHNSDGTCKQQEVVGISGVVSVAEPKGDIGRATDSHVTSSSTNESLTPALSSSPKSSTQASAQATSQRSKGKNSATAQMSKPQDAPSPIKSSVESSPVKKSSSDLETSTSLTTERSVSELETSTDSSYQLEEEEVTEAMFASLPLQDQQMVIVTLTSSYLVEKDIKGKIKETLELRSLTYMDWTAADKKGQGEGQNSHNSQQKSAEETKDSHKDGEKEGGEEETGNIQLDLKFDYVRKDRQSRCYLLDAADGKIIRGHLQPFLDAREEEVKAKSSVIMQCLKCNRTFTKGELVHQRHELPTAGNSRDLQSLQKLMDTTTLVCPKCGSTIIIELEPATSTAKSAGSITSATSTPMGSYTSTSSMMENAKKPSENIKKPAPLIKRRSFDHTSPQATLAAKIHARKNSSDSLSSMLGKKGSHSGSFGRDNHARSPSVMSAGRDRSNAFSATAGMTKSLFVPGRDAQAGRGGELVCVEDHFSADTMTDLLTSRQLADMTTSLQGDSSTRGSFGRRRQLFKQNQHPENDTHNGTNPRTTPISITGSMERGESSVDGEGGQGREGQALEDRQRSASKISSNHRSLAIMEDIVNNLVSEGRSLEERGLGDMSRGSFSSLRESRSVSASVFRRASVSHGNRTSVGSLDDRETNGTVEGLRRNESSSSITVLPTPGADPAQLLGEPVVTTSMSTPVTFSVGTPIDSSCLQQMQRSIEEEVATVVSPLSSNICSSMVSSVYETSVNTPPDHDSIVDIIDGNKTAAAGGDVAADNAGVSVVMVGSSSDSSDDMLSIYDRPRQPKSRSHKKKSHSKHKQDVSAASVSVAGEESRSGKVDEVDDGQTVTAGQSDEPSADTTDVYSEPKLEQTSAGTSATVGAADGQGANDDDDDESDEEEEQGLSPQYGFSHLNHRLTLHMMMSLFGTDEQFICKIQAEVTQYIVSEVYEGILVMTSERFYILKITSPDHSQAPEEWLHCVEIQPIPELRYIDVGLGGQSLRLEFVTDASSYTLVTRNRDKTSQFVELLHTELAKYAVSHGITSQVVVNEDVDQTTLNNLDLDVVSKVKPDQHLLLYCMGYIERGNQKLFPVSFVVTTSDICLVRTNHQWPQPRLQPPLDMDDVGKQFTVLERQKINNVASVEVCEATMKKIRLELFNETEGIAASWNITMATRQTTVDFVNALSEPWAKEFGVEMEITYAELDF